ncbi:MAG: right-handed parallel beta-helix repeat-containing protein [Planctomycetota bacterium]
MCVRAIGAWSWSDVSVVLLGAVLAGVPRWAAAADVTLGPGSTGQDLIDALGQAVEGNTVTMAAVSYTLDQTLVVPTGVALRGAGKDATTLVYQQTAGGNDRAVIDLGGQANVTLTGFAIDGKNEANGASRGIVTASGGGHVIDDIAVRNLDGPGFGPIGVYLLGGSSNTAVTNSHFQNIGVDDAFGSGIRLLDKSDNVLIEGNTIDRTGRGGIFAKGSDNPTPGGQTIDGLVIRGNKVTHSALAVGTSGAQDLGIELQFAIRDAVIEGNTIDRRVSLDGVDGVAVRNNTVTQTINWPDPLPDPPPSPDPASFGLELVDSQNVVFRGNTVDATANVGFGVSISGDGVTQYAVFEGNTIDGANDFGVQVQGDDPGGKAGRVERVYLSRNQVTNTTAGSTDTGDSIRLNEAFDDITLDTNRLGVSDGSDVFAANIPPGAQVTLSGNTVITPGGDRPLATEGSLVPSPGFYVLRDPALTRQLFTFRVGDDVAVTFDDLTDPDDSPSDLTRVLWDLGTGSPLVTGDGDLPDAALLDLSFGRELLAVGWADDGRSDSVLVRIVPEPAAALALLGGAGLAFSRRSSRRSRPSPSSP